MTKFIVKTINLSLVFSEGQHLVVVSPIMKVWFQRTWQEGFDTHYFIEVSSVFVISKPIIRNSPFLDYTSKK